MNAKRNYAGFVDLISGQKEYEPQSIDVRITAADYHESGLPYPVEVPLDYESPRYWRESS